ncbi:hypothetical protein COO91_00227 [Nostoc flagelliforme CCNUN1]|uniref:Uncharacterized protein n=1 Tax=Nostoc flagelliforme CCNUN1 TaxID=2038116 RepID=A0A2K8SG48_9NOSO|nr:hypothetical protein COO91_00227 [Nostoc flagelliforme CCNUN1]
MCHCDRSNSDTSAVTATALPPISEISSTKDSSPAWLRADTTNDAPRLAKL